jgi:hypothetical protein
MSSDVTIQWVVPPSVLGRNVGDYAQRLLSAVFDLAQYFAGKIESFAKQHAPWTDRTGNARQGLTARAFRTATAVTIVLWHSMAYGIWLEVKNAGRFAAILPSLEQHYQPFMRAVEGLMR